ncbi:hypothetical protein CPB97_006232 [Podila verticillata]|nr:hypothetical protein CPB97_006232 [Podila verticillata]
MKTLLAPLLAIALAGMALGASEEKTVINVATDDSAVPVRSPYYVYGYWPGKRPLDPDTRIWDWSGDKVTVIYRDPSENEKSIAKVADEGYINIPEDTS